MSSTLANKVKETARSTYGTVPNLFKQTNPYTGVPGAVYMTADETLMDGLLAPSEQQVVLLTMAQYHDSRYDAIIHARLGLDAGLSPTTIERLLANDPVQTPRIQVLVEATRRSCKERGWLSKETLKELEERGLTRGELYEIFAFIGLKTLTSFTSHIADPTVDGPLKEIARSFDNVPGKPDTLKRKRFFVG